MKIKFEWEYLDSCERIGDGALTSRAKVLGGWVVKHCAWYKDTSCESMVFVSDPKHEWEIEQS